MNYMDPHAALPTLALPEIGDARPSRTGSLILAVYGSSHCGEVMALVCGLQRRVVLDVESSKSAVICIWRGHDGTLPARSKPNTPSLPLLGCVYKGFHGKGVNAKSHQVVGKL